ncbi:MAG: phosphoribosylanthranilate isomerase [Rhodobacter sp.]|nr:phosphoribosylanthranilate isomerase [Rhodobacter sp.]
MGTDIKVKICGLNTPESITTAVAAGAAYVGLNFFPRSPRYVSIAQAAALAASVQPGVCKVALCVDEEDPVWDAILARVPIDMLQLHGHESPERVLALKARHGLPVMKVVSVADAGDLAALDEFGKVADQILVDTKPPSGAVLPGGNGVAFDWRLIAGRRWPVPWMLAGGLTADNVAEAIRLTGAQQVDVSSGVESAPGIKDAGRIQCFIKAARA